MGLRRSASPSPSEQADYARRRAIEEGVADRVEIRVQDYRDVHDGPFDAIASIGMAEHVGQAMLPTYSANLFALLSPGGRLLNHAISRRPGPPDALLADVVHRPLRLP